MILTYLGCVVVPVASSDSVRFPKIARISRVQDGIQDSFINLAPVASTNNWANFSGCHLTDDGDGAVLRVAGTFIDELFARAKGRSSQR